MCRDIKLCSLFCHIRMDFQGIDLPKRSYLQNMIFILELFYWIILLWFLFFFLYLSAYEISQKFSPNRYHSSPCYSPYPHGRNGDTLFCFTGDDTGHIRLGGWTDSFMGELELYHPLCCRDDRIISIHWRGGSWYECDDTGRWFFCAEAYECFSSFSHSCYGWSVSW